MLKTLLGTLGAIVFALQAHAAERQICGPHKDLVAQLAARFGEQPVVIGVSDNGHLIEILAQRASGTFTVVATTPQGIACIVIAGEAWEARLLRAADPEA